MITRKMAGQIGRAFLREAFINCTRETDKKLEWKIILILVIIKFTKCDNREDTDG